MARKGYLRLATGRIDTLFTQAGNTLTQRTIGPACSAVTALDVSKMKAGDFAGLALLQRRYGLAGVKYDGMNKSMVMISAETERPVEVQRIPLTQNVVYLKAVCDFHDMKDIARFFYSIDGKSWTPIGAPLHMAYTLPHFMGYRFGLFNYATRETGGYVDFDFFRIESEK